MIENIYKIKEYKDGDLLIHEQEVSKFDIWKFYSSNSESFKSKIRNYNILKSYEFKLTGNYILLDSKEKKIYIGESDNVIKRIEEHFAKRKWIQKCFLIISGGKENLSKDHIRYYESKIINLIKIKLNNLELVNKTKKFNKSFEKEEKERLEANFNKIKKILQFILFDFFIKNFNDSKPKIFSQLSVIKEKFINIHIKLDNKYIKGILDLKNYSIIIKKNQNFVQTIRKSFAPRWNNAMNKANQANFRKFHYESFEDNKFRVTIYDDMIFKKPSQASEFVLGRSSNGWIDWKDQKTNQNIDFYRNK